MLATTLKGTKQMGGGGGGPQQENTNIESIKQTNRVIQKTLLCDTTYDTKHTSNVLWFGGCSAFEGGGGVTCKTGDGERKAIYKQQCGVCECVGDDNI